MRWILTGVAVAAMTGLSGGAIAQDAPPPAVEPAAEVLDAAAPVGPQWKVFSRSDQSNYLIDLSSIRPEGDELRVSIARVAKTAEAGTYAHVVDTFGLRCAAAEAHVVSSTEVFEDGEGSDTFQTDEPWAPIRPRTLDEGIKDLACENMVPTGTAYGSIRDYIEAGRP